MSCDFFDKFEDPELARKWHGRFQLINVMDLIDEELLRCPYYGPMKYMMKYSRSPDFIDGFRALAPIWRK